MSTITDHDRVIAEPAPGDHCVLVSSDSHVGPSVRHQLREYCDARHLAEFDEYADRLDAVANATDDLSVDLAKQVAALAPKANRDLLAKRSQLAGLQDPDARVRDMDADGVTTDVVYHGGLNGQPVPFFNLGIAAWGSSDYDHLEPVGVHIYNRWLVDYVSVAPERFVGVAHITVRDVDKAIAEATWAREHGLTAINLPSPRRDFRPYTDPVWEPFWAACAEMDLALCTHGGGGDLDTRHGGAMHMAMFCMEYTWLGRRAVWQMILSGVFERYPSLQLVLAEQFGDWIPATLKEMDSTYRWAQLEVMRQQLPKLPSEYFMQNVSVGCSFMSHEEAVMGVEAQVSDRLLWGSDYPHPEGTWPHTRLSLRKTFAGLDRSAIAAYGGGNAIRSFRLDRARLEPVAERIGPTFAELQEPFDSRPDDVPSTLAFRSYGHWV